jgi:hypothetical protein
MQLFLQRASIALLLSILASAPASGQQQNMSVGYNLVSIKRMAALGVPVPPATKDHINILVNNVGPQAVAVQVEVHWGETIIRRISSLTESAAGLFALESIVVPAGANLLPDKIIVRELRAAGEPVEVQP